MSYVLDPASNEPLYEQIARPLRLGIRRGEIAPGAQLPAMRKAAAAAGVSYTTVKYAYQALAAEGWVEITPRGVFALSLPHAIDPDLTDEALRSFRRAAAQLWRAGIPRASLDACLDEFYSPSHVIL